MAYENFGTDGLAQDRMTDDIEFKQADEIGGGKGSGVPVDVPYAHLFRFPGERADQWPVYPDRQEALKAVGLSE